jgi:hypothetical protein
MQRSRSDEQVFKSDTDSAGSLLGFNAARQFRDLRCNRLHNHIPAQFRAKRSTPFTLLLTPRPINPMRDLDYGYGRQRRIHFSVHSPNSLEDFLDTLSPALARNQDAGVKN